MVAAVAREDEPRQLFIEVNRTYPGTHKIEVQDVHSQVALHFGEDYIALFQLSLDFDRILLKFVG